MKYFVLSVFVISSVVSIWFGLEWWRDGDRYEFCPAGEAGGHAFAPMILDRRTGNVHPLPDTGLTLPEKN